MGGRGSGGGSGGKLLIRGGRVIDPASGLDQIADVLIEDGLIRGIGREIRERGGQGDLEVVEAEGKLVAPGPIDIHVHLREPGREDEETVESGAEAAAAGGFTGVAAMANTEPPIDDAGAVRSIVRRAQGAKVRIYPIAAVTKGQMGQEITEMADLLEAGAVAFSDDGNPIEDAGVMRSALEYSKMFDVAIITHSEVKSLTEGGQMNEGRVSSILGLKGIPRIAEEMIIARDLALVEYVGGRLHVAHVSTAGSVELIREAKGKGLSVTCEATPHHFTLTEEEIRSFSTNLKMSPPLRTAEDVEAIKVGLADGTIDAIASDHAPHSTEEKDVEFEAAPFGIIGLETSLGLVLTELVRPGILSLMDAVAKMTIGPAGILGIEGGRLEVGGVADLTIIDPEMEWTVDPEEFKSKSRNLPFGGRKLKGRAVMTVVGGEVMSNTMGEEA